MADDDIEEYMDPELDPVAATDSSSDDIDLPGPITLPRLVAGIHFAAGLALTPFAWSAYQNGGTLQAASFLPVIVLLFIAGGVMARITAMRY